MRLLLQPQQCSQAGHKELHHCGLLYRRGPFLHWELRTDTVILPSNMGIGARLRWWPVCVPPQTYQLRFPTYQLLSLLHLWRHKILRSHKVCDVCIHSIIYITIMSHTIWLAARRDWCARARGDGTPGTGRREPESAPSIHDLSGQLRY